MSKNKKYQEHAKNTQKYQEHSSEYKKMQIKLKRQESTKLFSYAAICYIAKVKVFFY